MANTPILNTQVPAGHVGVREDLSDIITLIDPDETPLLTALRGSVAKNTLFEWQTQKLRDANVTNRHLQGADTTEFNPHRPTRRLNNQTQISIETGIVSGTMEAVEVAGIDSELGRQKMIKGKELKIDKEAILFNHQVAAAESGTTPSSTATLAAWISNIEAVAADQSAFIDASDELVQVNGSVLPDTGGADRALTLALIDSAMLKARKKGGKPRHMYVSPVNKANFSNLAITDNTLIEHRITSGNSKPVTATGVVDFYKSDHGEVAVVEDVHQPDDAIYGLEHDHWRMKHTKGRQYLSIPLAKTGDAEKFQLLSEWGVECRAPSANWAIYDLNGS